MPLRIVNEDIPSPQPQQLNAQPSKAAPAGGPASSSSSTATSASAATGSASLNNASADTIPRAFNSSNDASPSRYLIERKASLTSLASSAHHPASGGAALSSGTSPLHQLHSNNHQQHSVSFSRTYQTIDSSAPSSHHHHHSNASNLTNSNSNPSSSPILIPLPPPLQPDPYEDEILHSMSTDELRKRLKDALNAIREKERDLIIAAEIGQQLVAANTSLAAEYEALASRISGQPSSPIPNPSLPTPIPSGPSSPSRIVTAPAVSSPPSHSALRASKRASMSLSMSRLAGGEGADEEESAVGGLVGDASAAAGNVAAVEGLAIEGVAEMKRKLAKRKSTNGMYEYVLGLERANAELRDQLKVTFQNLTDADRIHKTSMVSLRKTNSALQDQIRSTLEDLRDAEKSHAKAVSTLEVDLEKLRADWAKTSEERDALENERKRLLKSGIERVRELEGVAGGDAEVILQLQERVRELEGEIRKTKDVEGRYKKSAEEIQSLREVVSGMEEEIQRLKRCEEEKGRLEVEVEELREQVEEARRWVLEREEEFRGSRDGTVRSGGDRLAMVLGGEAEEKWEWTPWLNSVRNKCWDRDMDGLRTEISNLQAHRVEAYQRLRSEMDVMMHSIVSILPAGLQSITTRVVGIPASPPPSGGGFLGRK
ncbi:hypothetical protein HDU97_000120 [Phlyctochytrium planicorne]|nr:hypothetical protein HDU97_000120 [Phlyctochytrium planicorne]